MDIHLNLSRILSAGVFTLLFSHAFAANHNPCDVACTQKLITDASNPAALSLTAADWNAACTSGTPAQSGGCFGNISSPAFDKINTALGGFASMANIPVTNVPRSVYLIQFFGGSSNTIDPSHLDVFLNTTDTIAASCVLAVTEGSEIGYNGLQNCTTNLTSNAINSMPNKVTTLQGPTTSARTCDQQYQACNNASAHYTPVNVPIYLICIGNTIDGGGNNIAASFTQISAS